MKKFLTKILSIALVLVMVMCLVPPVEAAASSKKPYFPTNLNYHYYTKDKSLNKVGWGFGDYGVDYKITGLKSSNKKVIAVSSKYSNGATSIYINVKKAGKATVSFKAKVGNKTYNYKCKFVVTNYANPLKSIKIGKVNYTSKFSKRGHLYLPGKKNISGKLVIKPKKDWKITDLFTYSTITGKIKKIKNNKNVSLKKNQALHIGLKNRKTGKTTSISFSNHKW